MGFLIRKQKGLIFTGIARLGIIMFIMAFAFALIDTIWAVYLYEFVKNNAYVGFISAFLTLVSFFSFFFTIPLVEKSNKTKLLNLSLFLFGISYLLFAFNSNFYFVIVLAFIVTILHTLRITSFGIILKDKSSEKQLSRNEGLMYTFMNTSWLIGPLIAGLLSEKYGIPIIFLLSAVFIFISLFLLKISKINDNNIKKKVDNNLIKNFFDFFKDKNRTLAYILGGGVNFWWSLIYLFTPLYIINNGLEIEWIGYFLFAIAVPLILLEYVFSKIAGKSGFKKMFKIGFLIPSIFAIACFFINSPYIVLLVLVLSSVGLAMLEGTTEAYFFDVLKNKKAELRFYGPYNTTIDVNHFIGRIIASVILLFLPFKFVFLFFGVMMFVFFLISFKVKNVVEKRRDGKKN
ncbi:MAG: MFS transporter [Candidatus Pacearchaeota archaeon]